MNQDHLQDSLLYLQGLKQRQQHQYHELCNFLAPGTVADQQLVDFGHSFAMLQKQMEVPLGDASGFWSSNAPTNIGQRRCHQHTSTCRWRVRSRTIKRWLTDIWEYAKWKAVNW